MTSSNNKFAYSLACVPCNLHQNLFLQKIQKTNWVTNQLKSLLPYQSGIEPSNESCTQSAEWILEYLGTKYPETFKTAAKLLNMPVFIDSIDTEKTLTVLYNTVLV